MAPRPEIKAQPYLVFSLLLSSLSLAILSATALLSLDRDTQKILDYTDNVLCAFFFSDFIIMFIRAEKKGRYFFTWGWLDLLSSIPTIEILRLGRLARVMRIFRVLRSIRSARVFTTLILQKRAENGLLAVALISMLLVVVSSIAVLQFERGADGNIQTAEDALWWSMTTITTVGYGDRYPVTSEGKAIAVALMLGGISLFGTFLGFVAAWFVAPSNASRENEIAALQTQIAKLKKLLTEKQSPGLSPDEEKQA